MPSDDELSATEGLVAVLEVFNNATEIISGEKYPTLGMVLPLLHKLLLYTLAEAETDKSLTKKIKKPIREDLQSRHQDDEVKRILSIAMYLDPRFKAMPFLTDAEKANVRLQVKMKLIELIDAALEGQEDLTDLEPAEPDNSSASETPSAKKRKFTEFFEGIITPSDKLESASPHDIASTELKKVCCRRCRLSRQSGAIEVVESQRVAT